MKIKTLSYIILGLLLLTTLINVNLFENIGLSAFYFYCICSSVVVLGTSIFLIKKNNPAIIPRPIIFFFLLVFFYFVQGLFITGTGISEQHYYLLISFLLFVISVLWLNNNSITIKGISRVITLLLALESVYCFLQLSGILPSFTPFFRVTGSWVNPNVTALFLAMGFPALLHLFLNEDTSQKRGAYLLIIVCVVAALWLLKCRTAFIALAAGAAIQLNGKYQIARKLKSGPLKLLAVSLLVVSFVSISGIAYYMYQSKAASANGRLFIWKVSLKTALEKPITGHGYGYFARNYNLQQAEYFSTGKATPGEIKNSDYVLLAYNEFIQQLVEGGIVALILILLFLGSLLTASIRNKRPYSHAATAGIVSFLIICCFNFAMQAIPVFCLFILYAAFVCQTMISETRKPGIKIKASSLTFNRATVFFLSAMSIFTLSVMSTKANVSIQTREATQLLQEQRTGDAIEILQDLSEKHSSSGDCWTKLANALYVPRRYKEALYAFEEAEKYSSQPDLFLKKGFCLLQTNDINGAIENCKIASDIAPNRLEAKYALMNIHILKRDSAVALVYAREIASQIPKIVSPQADFYKKQAASFINTSKRN